MTKGLFTGCLLIVFSSLATAQLAPALLNWDGEISKIATLPATLVATGFNKNDLTMFKPYTVNVPQWRGFMQSNRYIYLPAGQKVIPGDSVNYTFPVGTVLIRDTYIDLVQGDPSSRVFVEVQFQIMKANNEFSRLTYVYQEDGSAVPVTEDGLFEKTFTVNVNNTNSNYPPSVQVPYTRSSYDCELCHFKTTANGFITQQLNDGIQLNNLVAAGVLTALPPAKLVRWYDWNDSNANLTQKVLSYLGANCSHCHTHRNDLKDMLIDHSFEYFSKPPLNVFDGDTNTVLFKPDFTGTDSSGSYAIVRIAKKQMPQAEQIIPDQTAISKMVEFTRTVLHVSHMPAGKASFQAILRNNLLRFSRPGPAKLFDLSGRAIELQRIDGSTFLVAEALKPGIYIAKMGTRTIRVRHL